MCVASTLHVILQVCMYLALYEKHVIYVSMPPGEGGEGGREAVHK